MHWFFLNHKEAVRVSLNYLLIVIHTHVSHRVHHFGHCPAIDATYQLPIRPQPLAPVILLCHDQLDCSRDSYEWSHIEFFCNWLISHSITSSRVIHVVASVRISLLFKAE